MNNHVFKQIAIWGGVLAATLIGVIVIINASNSLPGSNSTQATTRTPPPITNSDLTQGLKSSKATLIEYADFQCPACGAYYPLVKQLLSDYKGKIFYVYRYFPLKQIHQNAMLAAQASYAANLQGQFWPMYNLLYQNQNKWANLSNPMDTFVSYAKSLNLNTSKFTKDTQAQGTIDFINNEENAGIQIGINHTPTFFLNGKEVAPQSYEQFKQLINQALK